MWECCYPVGVFRLAQESCYAGPHSWHASLMHLLFTYFPLGHTEESCSKVCMPLTLVLNGTYPRPWDSWSSGVTHQTPPRRCRSPGPKISLRTTSLAALAFSWLRIISPWIKLRSFAPSVPEMQQCNSRQALCWPFSSW